MTNFKVRDKIRMKENCSGLNKGQSYVLMEDQNALWAGREKKGDMFGCCCQFKWELISEAETKFKVGDRVKRIKDPKEVSLKHIRTIIAIPNDTEFISNCSCGRANNDRQDNKDFSLYKEAKMDIRERIEELTGWDKEADDLIMEICRPMHNRGPLSINICRDTNSTGKDCFYGYIKVSLYGPTVEKSFSFTSQCEKLERFKEAIKWLAEKAGLLDDKKDKIREEIAILDKDFKERLKALEAKLNE